jgi:hypothetical protein
LGFVVAGVLSAVASFLVTLVGGIGFFGWFLIAAGAPTAAVNRGRCAPCDAPPPFRPLFITVVAGVVLGALPVILYQVLSLNLFGIVFQVIYLVIAVPLVYTRLSGIQLFR